VIYEKLHQLEAIEVGKSEDEMEGVRDPHLLLFGAIHSSFIFNSRENSEYPGQDGSEDHIEHHATSN
jgi:hypothetical protein